MSGDRYAGSRAWLARAKAIIPGAHHLSSRPLLPDEDGPIYFERGRGARIWDVDGNEYVDFFMGFGPFLLGYANREVDAAATRQLGKAALLSMSRPEHVRFVEALLAWFPAAEMGLFMKTGSEATTAALRIARRATGRRKVVRAGYHGWHDWCLPLETAVPAGLDEQVLEFAPNEPGSLASVLDGHRGEVAAVIVAPEMVHTPSRAAFVDMVERTHAAGAVFVLDEVKTAIRIAPGSVQERFDFAPDITTVSKALGNGWPVAAVLGKRDVMRAAAGLHVSATFHGDTASMAAAHEVMKIVRRDGVADKVWALGRKLIEGLNAQATAHGIAARAFGEPLPPMPFLAFESEVEQHTFYRHVLARGFLLHPRHMWFVSAAHAEEDIARLLDVSEEAFALLRREGSE